MNQKGFVNIVLVLVIIVLSGAVGYFTLTKKQEPVIQQTITPSLVATKTLTQQTPTLKPVADEIKNWKTYHNEKYNFSLSYPPNWYEIEDKFRSFLRFGLSPQNPPTERPTSLDVLFFIYENFGDYLDQGRRYVDNDVYLSLKSNIESGSKLGRLKYESILFNGLQSYLVDAGRDGSSIQLEHGGRIYLIILPRGISDTSQLNDVQKQILSSFKFLR